MKQRDVKQGVGTPNFYCDMCAQRGLIVTVAEYDAKSKYGPWAYMCESCFKEYGIGLGIGKGQKIIKEDE